MLLRFIRRLRGKETIKDLQHRGKKLHYKLEEIASMYDCGISMVRVLNSDYNRIEKELNNVMSEIKERMEVESAKEN